MKKIWKLVLLIIVIIVLDQLTKFVIYSRFSLHESIPVIDGFFNITYIQNPGAAFGFMANAHESIRRPLFLFIPILACVWLLVLIWQSREKNTILGMSYGLIFAGAVGNLIDRFTLKYVIDFLDFYYQGKHFPAFNVADSAITIAAGLLIIDGILAIKRKVNNPNDTITD